MIVRHALNFTAHLIAGIAVGALAVAALRAVKGRETDDWRTVEPVRQEGHVDESS